jgi:hypothetical protein
MDWFRMYGDFATDPKVQALTEVMQRRLVMLMCLRSTNVLVTLQDEEIGGALRINAAQVAEMKDLLQRRGFIKGQWELTGWARHQLVSDTSAKRVAKHRARGREQAEAIAKRHSNVTPAVESGPAKATANAAVGAELDQLPGMEGLAPAQPHPAEKRSARAKAKPLALVARRDAGR